MSRQCSYNRESSVIPSVGEESKGDVQKQHILLPRSISCPALTSSYEERGTPSTALFHHICSNWEVIFGFSRDLTPLHLSHTHACIHHSLLAVSACHLRHVLPDSSTPRIAEHFHLSLALRDYQRALRTSLEDVDRDRTDVLLMTAMLLNTSSFALPSTEDPGVGHEPDVGKSWVFNPSQVSLGWLSMQMGLKPLLIATNRWQHQSAFRPAFEGFKYDKGVSPKKGLSYYRLPITWSRFLGLNTDEGSGLSLESRVAQHRERTDNEHAFREPAALLDGLRHLEPTPGNIYRYLQFLGKLNLDFRVRLLQRDKRALWLFGYWLGLMHRYTWLWWCDRRARRDFEAIVMWLEQTCARQGQSEEDKIRRQAMAELKESRSLSTGSVEDHHSGLFESSA